MLNKFWYKEDSLFRIRYLFSGQKVTSNNDNNNLSDGPRHKKYHVPKTASSHLLQQSKAICRAPGNNVIASAPNDGRVVPFPIYSDQAGPALICTSYVSRPSLRENDAITATYIHI